MNFDIFIYILNEVDNKYFFTVSSLSIIINIVIVCRHLRIFLGTSPENNLRC